MPSAISPARRGSSTAPAKRRLGAVTVGHMTPETAAAGLDPDAAALRELRRR
jgi:cobalamin biosynthesis Mg chelatase CobN